MSKTFISPKHDDFAQLTEGEESEFYGWVPADEFVAAQAARIAELESLLRHVDNCAEPCNNCEESGVEIGTEDACRVCGGYGFNVHGDIREIVLDIRESLQAQS